MPKNPPPHRYSRRPGVDCRSEQNRHCHRTLAEVSDLTGLSKERIRQIEAEAIRKMARHPLMVELAKEWGIV